MTNVPTTTALAAKRPIYVGIDVGGTNIKFGLVDDDGNTVIAGKIATESERGPQDAVERMAAKIAEMLQVSAIRSDDLAAVGLATPGTMDLAAGMILEPYNLPSWRHFAIRKALMEACGKPVVYANDAGAAGFGEFWRGCGIEHASIVLLTIGTGIGAGIILGDLSIDGEHSHGAECGHNLIDCRDDARMCSCGQRGHLEAYSSATAMVKHTQELLAAGRDSPLRHRAAAGEEITTLTLAQEAERGDSLAQEVIDEAAYYLGIGIVSIAHTIDPSIFVLGGAATFGGNKSVVGRRFLQRIMDEFRRRALPVLAEKTKIDFAQLGGDAGYIGAAGLARVWHRRQPAGH